MLRLRVVRDRGQILIYLASLEEPARWWALDFVLEAIQGQLPESSLDLDALGDRI